MQNWEGEEESCALMKLNWGYKYELINMNL